MQQLLFFPVDRKIYKVLVAESLGGLHKLSIQQIRQLARHTGIDESKAINHLMTRERVMLNLISNHLTSAIGGEL